MTDADPLEALLAKRLAAVPREDRDDSPNSLCGRYVALARENDALRRVCLVALGYVYTLDIALDHRGLCKRLEDAAEGREVTP